MKVLNTIVASLAVLSAGWAAAAGAAVAGSGTVVSNKFTPPAYMHAHLKPSETFWTSTVGRLAWDDGSTLSPQFDIIQGSADPGMDLANRDRGWQPAKYIIDAADGFVHKVELGYVLASGRAPIVAGRRVRGAASGTQFAIEVFQIMSATEVTTIERVHLFTVASGKDLRLKIYGADDLMQTGTPKSEKTLKDPYDFYELKESRNLSTGAVTESELTGNTGTLGAMDLLHFQLEMLKLIGDSAFPPDAARPSAVAEERMSPTREISQEAFNQLQADHQPRTLLQRFVNAFPAGTTFRMPAQLLGIKPKPPKEPGQDTGAIPAPAEK